MPSSADVTLGGSGNGGVYADETQHTATLRVSGGVVSNPGSESLFINVDGGSIQTVQPLGASVHEVAVGGSYPLPKTCKAFTFGCAAGKTTYFDYCSN